MKAGWQEKPFLECIQDVTYSTKIQRKDFLSTGKFPVISQEDDFINGYWNNESDLFKVNSPLIIFGDHTKCLKYVDFDFVLGADGVKILPPREFLEPKFFYYQLQTANLESLGYARHYKLLKELNILYPNLTEQQRIVAILDKAFEQIAIARANTEKNLQNARALFESHLQNVFTQRGHGWVEKKLEDICSKITDGTHHSPQIQFSEPGESRFPYITSKNIRNNCMDLSKISYIEKAFHDEVYSRCKPELGDVLLTKDGANTGNVTLNTLDEPFSLLSSVCLIKTNQTILKPAFLCYYLQSPIGLSSIIGQMSGAAIKRIVLKDIKKAVIPFPSLDKQNKVIDVFNTLLSETQRLESLYQRKLDALDAFKKSLLHQAFAGEL